MYTFVDRFRGGAIAPAMLAASAVVGFLALIGISVWDNVAVPVASMRIEPFERIVSEKDTFTVDVIVESAVPVNVFAGELRFNKDMLMVDAIDYNISIADLWAELPWYSNGDGTLNFAGGTTRPGGFQGRGELIKVTFKTLGAGDGVISVHEPRILLHDGLGTDAEVYTPIDAIFTVETESGNLIAEVPRGTSYRVKREVPSTDLNGDGRQSVADISIFMMHIAGNNERYDFNLDGDVNIRDLNILLAAK